MASLGRSFKPLAYFSPRSRRPAGPTRNLSNTSNSPEQSPASPLDSPGLAIDNPQAPTSSQRYKKSGSRYLSRSVCFSGSLFAPWEKNWLMNLPNDSGTRSPPRSINIDDTTKTIKTTKTTTTTTPPPRSQPIAIELPPGKKLNSSLPIAPLSARGDTPGGYFPLHEEQSRVYRHHPFQLDAARARMESVQRASQDHFSDSHASVHRLVRGDVSPATRNLSPALAERNMEVSQLDINNYRLSESLSSSTTPVASYIPLGDQNTHLPVGRYYPTNYENRKDKKGKRGKGHRSKTPDPTTFKSNSDSQVPSVNQPSALGHARNDSEARRRLQQYQRDMVAQATMALNRNQATLSSARSLKLSNISGPSKPRLVPMGSPGPVTPMDLEGSDGGYLGVHGAIEVRAEAEEKKELEDGGIASR
ncbi:hypothetical protein GGS21DRAFT_538156 [Xylaria nigripes]|nr:hypothetical protein GGS21DRAFT_538156 [Xylaria nigripes]